MNKVFDLTRNGRTFTVCANTFGTNDILTHGEGCWVMEEINVDGQAPYKIVNRFLYYGFDPLRKIQHVTWRKEYRDANGEQFLPSTEKTIPWNDPVLYQILADNTTTIHGMEQDIFRRAINGWFESEGLDYAFDSTLAITDGTEREVIPPVLEGE